MELLTPVLTRLVSVPWKNRDSSEAGIELPIKFDQGMYSWNHLWVRSGDGAVWGRPIDDPCGVKREIRDSGVQGDDRIRVSSDDDLRPVYQKKTLGCSGKPEIIGLKGPQGHAVPGGKPVSFLLQYDLQFCAPLSFRTLLNRSQGLSQCVRLNFTVEEPAAAGEILDAFFEEYGMREKRRVASFKESVYARHFKRSGVGDNY